MVHCVMVVSHISQLVIHSGLIRVNTGSLEDMCLNQWNEGNGTSVGNSEHENFFRGSIDATKHPWTTFIPHMVTPVLLPSPQFRFVNLYYSADTSQTNRMQMKMSSANVPKKIIIVNQYFPQGYLTEVVGVAAVDSTISSSLAAADVTVAAAVVAAVVAAVAAAVVAGAVAAGVARLGTVVGEVVSAHVVRGGVAVGACDDVPALMFSSASSSCTRDFSLCTHLNESAVKMNDNVRKQPIVQVSPFIRDNTVVTGVRAHQK